MHPETPLIDRRSVRTIRLVSDVPDFASLCSDSPLTPRVVRSHPASSRANPTTDGHRLPPIPSAGH
jgi:hypothetical protein